MRRVKQASELLTGVDGPVVLLSARACAWLLRYAELDRYHLDHRGEDAEIDQSLIALKTAAFIWRDSATGTKNAAKPELPADSEWLSTKQAADALAMTDRAIRKAIREKRLQANTVGRAYRINREQLAHFKARKGTP
ncbi:excisionase family DNA-binding protein [Curtobacterium flaccumfaciens pv. flaccumfaciens]|uniref:excisionase family DNA-binding protein n=1 Tax=Curtobacterium flaccumfaciens TaxID=2035 RepID=UPI0012679256|nr:excisionase family DNA-binding protein [Curtobacterium flaccumfaciens pv. flaccumfaciens]QTR91586.1 excisionase family DNA-binding protein [Curtobacterium flaccumfaciens pv. flaccumfaciens]